MENKTNKHSVGGIILVILSILVALFCPLLLGVIGGAISVILAVIAVILAVRLKKKGGKGTGVIVMSVLAIVLALVMTVTTVAAFTGMREAVKSYGDAPLVEKYLDNPAFGMVGIIVNASKDGESIDLEELQHELDLLTERTAALTTTEAR